MVALGCNAAIRLINHNIYYLISISFYENFTPVINIFHMQCKGVERTRGSASEDREICSGGGDNYIVYDWNDTLARSLRESKDVSIVIFKQHGSERPCV